MIDTFVIDKDDEETMIALMTKNFKGKKVMISEFSAKKNLATKGTMAIRMKEADDKVVF